MSTIEEMFRTDPILRELLGDMCGMRVGGKPLRLPGYSYFQKRHGSMFCWSKGPDPDHKLYWCWTYQAVGRGSRTNDAKRWEVKDLTSRATRRAAKAEAARRYWEANPRT